MNERETRTASALVFGALALGGCSVQHIAPPPVPPMETPRVDDSQQAAKPHTGRVIVDAVGEPARVDEVTALRAGFEGEQTSGGVLASIETRPLCPQTPCAVDLGFGSHILRYTRGGADARTSLTNVQVEAPRTAFRHDMGFYRTHPTLTTFGKIAQTTGIVLVSLGVPLLVGSAISVSDLIDDTEFRSTIGSIGTALTIPGVVLLAGGIVLRVLGRDEYQRGSQIQWTLPAAPSTSTSTSTSTSAPPSTSPPASEPAPAPSTAPTSPPAPPPPAGQPLQLK